MRYDYEVNAFIFDKETTHELSSMFEDDKKDSTLLTKEEYKKRSAWKRFVGWFANYVSSPLPLNKQFFTLAKNTVLHQ